MTAPIDVDDLRKTYRDGWLRRRGVEALRGVTFCVERGEVFGLLGPNGAGKTTFIKILLGIVRKSGGAAQLLGQQAGDLRSRRRVGYLPENLRISGYHTARSALEFYGKLSNLSGAEIRRRRPSLLETVGLADRAGDAVRKYSKGMVQRLGLAQALLHEPELLILDEPTDGLDPVGRSQVRQILRDLRDQGKTVFLNSHLLQEVELICDRVAILDRGRLRYVGPVADVAAAGGVDFVVDLQLSGAAAQMQAALGELKPESLRQSDEQIALSIRVTSQSQLDDLIDRLRAASISITGLTRRRMSLEDAFLRILKDA